MAETNNTEFKIVTGEKDDTVIVLLFGQIRSQEVQELEKMQNFLVEKPQPTVIISFRDVNQFLPGAHGTFARIQTALRKAGKLITLCSFKPEVKNMLLQAGVIRESEMFNNIPDAWQALKVRLAENVTMSKLEGGKAEGKKAA
jgi:anti-anti-sigma regulatory factor